ncbi:MAG: ImmA/IrrE family metallo-endopeptidase [Phycisphaerae bacterium]|nr:ImmA/IrrE family metallo-endopeptidase [Phycisphaerae bacterium]
MIPGIQGFKPHRLTEAREARCLSQAALAERIGMTRAAVCQYENGQRSPSREILLKISFGLAMPTHFFMQEDGYRVNTVVFFRSLASATRSLRAQAVRRFEWLVRIVNRLRDFLDFPEMRIPQFDVPCDPRQITSKRIEDLANTTRRNMGLGSGPISNITWLLENHGAIITHYGLNSPALDAFSNWCEGTPFLVLNAQEGTAVRWRYDLAHELGHMILHRVVDAELLDDPSIFRLIEGQANHFAGAFLLPEGTFGQTLPYAVTLDTLVAVKSKWKVSVAAMVMRLRNLNLISEKKKQRLFIAMSRRQWKNKEPLDDHLELEEPQLLRRAAELLRTHRIVDSRDLEACLGVAKEDIESLLGCEEKREEMIIRLKPQG